MDVIKELTADMLKKDAPEILIGSTVKVHVRIKEGEKERIQVFEGTVIAKNNSGIAETFTVRRVSYGVGVERVFPVHSPNVAKVELVRKGKIRRAKLYYLRDRVGKAANVKKKEGGRFILSPFLLLKNTGNQEKGGALWKKKKKLKPTRI